MFADANHWASPMFLTPPVDEPTAFYEHNASQVKHDASFQDYLEPKSVPMPLRLQELALLNGWKSAMPVPVPISSLPQEASWSEPPFSRWVTGIPPPPGLLPEPVVDTTSSRDVEDPHTSPPLQNYQEEVGFCVDVAKTSLDCKPANKELGLEVARLSLKQSAKTNRWWTMSRFPITCPFSGFPINLLPYPPFKLRRRANDPNPHSLVDGKYFALLVISSGSLVVNGRCLEQSEVEAIGQHIHRCKLGPHRPDVALRLSNKAQNLELAEHERAEAAQSLGKMRSAASCELSKLRWIQEQRLYQLHERLTLAADGMLKNCRNQESIETSWKCELRPFTKQDTTKSAYSTHSISTCSYNGGSSSSDSEDSWESNQ